MPPQPGQDPANRVTEHVQRITDGATAEVRAEDLTYERPYSHMEPDFPHGWNRRQWTPAEPCVQPQDDGQRSGNHQQIVGRSSTRGMPFDFWYSGVGAFGMQPGSGPSIGSPNRECSEWHNLSVDQRRVASKPCHHIPRRGD